MVAYRFDPRKCRTMFGFALVLVCQGALSHSSQHVKSIPLLSKGLVWDPLEPVWALKHRRQNLTKMT